MKKYRVYKMYFDYIAKYKMKKAPFLEFKFLKKNFIIRKTEQVDE